MNAQSCDFCKYLKPGLGIFSRLFKGLPLACLQDWAGLLKSEHALAMGSFLLPPQRSLSANRFEGSVHFISGQETVSQSTCSFDDLIKTESKIWGTLLRISVN